MMAPKPIDPPCSTKLGDPLLSFWGKTGDTVDASGASFPNAHPLVYHLLDVAACANAILEAAPERLRQLAKLAGVQPERLRGALLFLIAMHDIGKTAQGFQGKAPDFWPAALGAVLQPDAFVPVRHDAAGLWLALNERRIAKLIEHLTPSPTIPSERAAILQAVAGHHGEPLQSNGAYVAAVPNPARQIGKAAQDAAAEIIEALFALFKPDPFSPPEDAVASFSFALAGLAVLADWLGSNRSWFAFAQPPSDACLSSELSRYWNDVASPAARKAIFEAGLVPASPALFGGLRSLFPHIAQATPLQRFAETAALPEGPALYVIEDMTGAGKTEAAVILAHRLLAAGRVRGVHVALPTMATANAMFARLSASYRRLFAPDASPSVVLVHGKRDLCEGFRTLPKALSYDDTHAFGGDPSETTASAFCSDWIARSRKQAFLAQMGAGTIDQALLAVLPSRHQALRLWGLADKALVIDEAHAYDAYMTKELETLLRFHAAFGGSAIILSATLPQKKRGALVDAYRRGLGESATVALRSSTYPLATVAGRAGVEEQPLGLREGLEREVRIRFVRTLEEAHARVVEAAQKGAAVAFIRNTVDEAIASHAAIAVELGEAMLFHARFALADRLAVEEKVLAEFGPTLKAKRGGVLVATQVIEQSLDLDFDLIVTDLAPVDLLIQRAGRLWRHMGKRPTFERPMLFEPHAPTLVVLSAQSQDDASEAWLDAVLPKTRFVYRDAALLWRSAKLLQDAGKIVGRESTEPGRPASGEIRALVEGAYGDERIGVPSGLESAENRAWGDASAERSAGARNVLRFEAGYAFDGGRWESDDHTPTRLGDETLTLRLARQDGERVIPWAVVDDSDLRRAWTLSEVSVRLNRCTGAAPDPALAALIEREKKSWTASERDTPVVVLHWKADGFWYGQIWDGKKQKATIRYSTKSGVI